jgi:hypothetical protein
LDGPEFRLDLKLEHVFRKFESIRVGRVSSRL